MNEEKPTKRKPEKSVSFEALGPLVKFAFAFAIAIGIIVALFVILMVWHRMSQIDQAIEMIVH